MYFAQPPFCIFEWCVLMDSLSRALILPNCDFFTTFYVNLSSDFNFEPSFRIKIRDIHGFKGEVISEGISIWFTY